MKLITVTNVLLAVLLVLVVYVAFFKAVPAFGASNPAATSYNSARIAEENVTTGTTTTFAILNTDATDRIITGTEVELANALSTTTSINVNCGTSTTASQIVAPATSYIFSAKLSAANIYGTTTAAGMYLATTSPGITGTSTASTLIDTTNAFARVWKTGTYLVCQVTTGDSYNALTSGTTGFISFPYRAQ